MGRIIDITQRETWLRTNCGRLSIKLPNEEIRTLPFSDVGVVLVSECAINLTGCVLADLAAAGIPVVLCGHDYLPASLLMPVSTHHAHSGVLQGQMAAYPSTLARLWQRIVRAKISCQVEYLTVRGLPDVELRRALALVSRGDASNAEGWAARAYWQALGIFPRRDRTAFDANRLLNYGYTVIYAAAARALCAAGLHPGLGLHHRNIYNACCLASDLMEPFRIAADHAVVAWLEAHPNETELSPKCKAFLLRTLLEMPWKAANGETSLFEALNRAAVSLRRCLLENTVELEIPEALCA